LCIVCCLVSSEREVTAIVAPPYLVLRAPAGAARRADGAEALRKSTDVRKTFGGAQMFQEIAAHIINNVRRILHSLSTKILTQFTAYTDMLHACVCYNGDVSGRTPLPAAAFCIEMGHSGAQKLTVSPATIIR
jgi:hypothetical protein